MTPAAKPPLEIPRSMAVDMGRASFEAMKASSAETCGGRWVESMTRDSFVMVYDEDARK
jgi:hypothetical protein